MRDATNTAQEHIEYVSLQALLFQQATLGLTGQVRVFYRHTRRLAS